MKQYQIEITELAEQDLENAGDYIAYELKNPNAAQNTVKGIRAQIDSLSNFPERNELDEDETLAGLGVRKDYYRNYKINVNNLTQSTTTYSVSFNWHGILCAFLYS